MPYGEQADIYSDVLETVEKENNSDQKQKMVVPRHHVLGAEIYERQELHPADSLDVSLVPRRNAMGKNVSAYK